MSYTMMENLLKPDFFNTSNDTIKTMMSTVISATLPKTTNTKLTKPVNFTFRHIRVRDWNVFLSNLRTDEHLKTSNIQCFIIFFFCLQEFDPSGSLSCVYWNISEWIVDGCSVLKTNSSYTVCSCVHLSTFALIMQTSRPPEVQNISSEHWRTAQIWHSCTLTCFLRATHWWSCWIWCVWSWGWCSSLWPCCPLPSVSGVLEWTMWLESTSASVFCWLIFCSCSHSSSWASYGLSRWEWWRSSTAQHSLTENHHNRLSWSPGVVCRDLRPSALPLSLRLRVDVHWSCAALHLCEEPITDQLQKEGGA